MANENGLAWDDSRLRVGGDTEWRAGCRLLQTWYRQEVLGLDTYGPYRKPKDGQPPEPPLVGSTLPLDAPETSNFLLNRTILEDAEARLLQKGWGGLVSEDRLRRNLLSSQPVAFNLFGSLKHHPRALLMWLASLGIDAGEAELRIEWAPPRAEHFGGGSAFDAAIFYITTSGAKGLVGVEVKYSENLDDQTIDPRDEYLVATRENGQWHSGASDRLREPRLTQLWLNSLLAQSCVEKAVEGISEAMVVTMACAADESALRATADVRAELVDPTGLMWCPFESVLQSVESDPEVAEWAEAFRRRYLDFAPVAEHLREGDLRREDDPGLVIQQAARGELGSALADAEAMASRVLGDGSVLDQIANADQTLPSVELLALAHRLHHISESMRSLRIEAASTHDRLEHL